MLVLNRFSTREYSSCEATFILFLWAFGLNYVERIGFRQKKSHVAKKEFASGKLLHKNHKQFVVSYVAIKNMELNLKIVWIKDFFTLRMRTDYFIFFTQGRHRTWTRYDDMMMSNERNWKLNCSFKRHLVYCLYWAQWLMRKKGWKSTKMRLG